MAEIEGKNTKKILEKNGVQCEQLEGRLATVEDASSFLPRNEIIHFACHGHFDNENPEQSGLLLNLPNKLTKKGVYFKHNFTSKDYISKNHKQAAGELLTLKYIWESFDLFNCSFLNLSACETGMISWVDKTDEFLGLPNGFLYSGVQSILSTLWPVDDTASMVFNWIFYQNLIKYNYNPPIALKSTIKSFKALTVEEYRSLLSELGLPINQEIQPSHPIFWACYRIIGKPL